MAAEHWLRLHHGTVTDPKWRVIASRCVTFVTVGHVVSVWAAMLENASQASPRGTLSGWDDEDIAVLFGYETEQVSAIRQAMQGKTLDGLKLISWEKRQPKREDSSSERTRAMRERKRDAKNEIERSVTQCDAASLAVTLETETETDKKKEKDIGQQAARKTADRFPEFWESYPVKKGKAEAESKWRAKGYDRIADAIIADVRRRVAEDRQWRDGFIPHGSTYVNGKGWEDAIEPTATASTGADDWMRRAV